MGVVYAAHQLSPARVVALKMIRFAQLASKLDIQRFNSEMDAIAKLSHPYIVPIYEIGSYRGEPFFTMPYIEGIDFGEYWLQQNSHARKRWKYSSRFAKRWLTVTSAELFTET